MDYMKIQAMASVPNKVRAAVQRKAQRHAEAQCNGNYYFNEDTNKWSDPKGKRVEQEIETELSRLFAGSIPSFVSYQNDPRGIVVKIEKDKLTAEAVDMCRRCNLVQDLGGDFGITDNNY